MFLLRDKLITQGEKREISTSTSTLIKLIKSGKTSHQLQIKSKIKYIYIHIYMCQNLQRNNVARQVEGFCISYVAAIMFIIVSMS